VNRGLLKKVITKSGLKHFKKNDILFKEREIGNEFFVIRKGSVKISRMINGVDVTQTYLSAGHYFVEMAVMDPESLPRSTTVTEAIACENLVIGKKDFLEFLYDDPVAQEKIAQMVKERRIANMTTQNNKESGAMLDFMLSKGLSDADNILLISSDLCVACDNCETTCASTHGHGGESFKSLQIPVSCHHCADPLCITDCPPDALTGKRDGEIIIKDNCIGCGNCEKNCPYDVLKMVYEPLKKSIFSALTSWFKPKVKDRGNAKAAKCDLCVTLPGGPADLGSCPTGAAMRVSPTEMFELIGNKL
jgi:Fe-S-cluster-containing hydrogenase component 2